MHLSLGDTVSVLDEDISGKVIRLSDNIVTIETNDDFELEFFKSELVKIDGDTILKTHIFSKSSMHDALAQKETKKRKITPRKSKERYQPTLEVDLHIHQLTPSSKGMSNHDMLSLQLDTARRQLEFAIRKRIQKIVFIHGVGEGILKLELEYLFARYDNVKFYDANFQKYGVGATEVYIFQNKLSKN